MIVDTEKKNIKAEIDSKIAGLHRLKFTPDGKTVCVVSVKTGDLLFYDTQTRKLEKQLNIGQGAGIYMDREGKRMFVSCTPNNYVAIVDLETRNVIEKLNIGRADGITSAIVK